MPDLVSTASTTLLGEESQIGDQGLSDSGAFVLFTLPSLPPSLGVYGYPEQFAQETDTDSLQKRQETTLSDCLIHFQRAGTLGKLFPQLLQ